MVNLVRPKISIVVPVYKGEHTLGSLIDQIVEIKSDPKLLLHSLIHELILVCDEPIDCSEMIVQEFASKYSWIHHLSLAKNSGQHIATAVGILNSSGDWILTIDEDLQHPPKLAVEPFLYALQYSLDIVYIKSKQDVHTMSWYRDLTSRIGKLSMRLFSSDDYSFVSSFRIIRAETARAIALCIDANSYLDTALFAISSPMRRKPFYVHLTDRRSRGTSGYTFLKLLQHYSRLVFSIKPSLSRLVLSIIAIVWIPLIISLLTILIFALFDGVPEIARGWLSLFAVSISISILLMIYVIYSIKLLSVLLYRSSGYPRFLHVDRSNDLSQYNLLLEVFGHL